LGVGTDRLIDEHAKDGLTDFALVKVLPLPLLELNTAAGSQKQAAILNVNRNYDLHRNSQSANRAPRQAH
jgi:hypothetical protein